MFQVPRKKTKLSKKRRKRHQIKFTDRKFLSLKMDCQEHKVY